MSNKVGGTVCLTSNSSIAKRCENDLGYNLHKFVYIRTYLCINLHDSNGRNVRAPRILKNAMCYDEQKKGSLSVDVECGELSGELGGKLNVAKHKNVQKVTI